MSAEPLPTTMLDPYTNIQVDLATPLLEPKPVFYGDDKGDVVSFRAPSKLNREIDIFLQSADGLGLKTRSDFYRAAGHFYLVWLTGAARIGHPGINRRLMEQRIAMDAKDKAEWITRRQQTLLDIHEYMTSLMNEMAFDEIHRALNEYFGMIRQITVLHWRDNYIRSVNGLAIVQLAITLLTQTGRGVPPEYTEAMRGLPGHSPDRGTEHGVPAGDEGVGPDAGLHDSSGSVSSPPVGDDAARADPSGDSGPVQWSIPRAGWQADWATTEANNS